MARTEARIRCDIFANDNFRALTRDAQWLYMAILAQKNLSLCGVLTWTPKRFAGLAEQTTVGQVRRALALLRQQRYVLLDEETDELWVRTFIKHDGVLANHNAFVGMSRAFEAVHSVAIREAIAHAVVEGLREGVTQGVLEGLDEGVPKGVLDHLPEGVRRRVAKPLVDALALACACARIPPASCLLPPASDLRFAPPKAERTDDTPEDVRVRKPRATDPLWEALIEAGLPKPTTPSAEKLWGKVTNELLASGATAEQVAERAAEYRRRWPDMEFTLNALHKHWDAMATPSTARRRPTTHNARILTDRDGPSVAWIPEGLQ